MYRHCLGIDFLCTVSIVEPGSEIVQLGQKSKKADSEEYEHGVEKLPPNLSTGVVFGRDELNHECQVCIRWNDTILGRLGTVAILRWNLQNGFLADTHRRYRKLPSKNDAVVKAGMKAEWLPALT
mmetsp:Transcript_20545/g.41758  ORF Transcript_20545/g.41758 Transcript_20545/m.41758 type:complete len:125 (+) Transcript_20545:257-631(+)|eukprot:CAMPEP_0174712044 /NCGR_PEP_ID=MMETSP1094-20130205/13167_1 /TAXON_ID=156173 /ORGANISM="Chrysochromulina brevifilum, Strain UTEX LB 985" /LENGTH=124 /DNA_ID=CAMNT_0015911057 /DNA_START=226 /DNA_END=600 /DNA_ORIENTATION=+